jgi:hypothetical protein
MRIDLDSSAPIDSGFSGAKFSSAFTPPELIRIEPMRDGMPFDLVPARPAHDVFALGVVL